MRNLGENMSKGKKIPLAQRVCERLDIPSGTLTNTSFVEIAGDREVTLSGCEALVIYRENEVKLRLCDGEITLRGEGLELRSFSGGRIAVRGTVRSICFGGDGGDDS